MHFCLCIISNHNALLMMPVSRIMLNRTWALIWMSFQQLLSLFWGLSGNGALWWPRCFCQALSHSFTSEWITLWKFLFIYLFIYFFRFDRTFPSFSRSFALAFTEAPLCADISSTSPVVFLVTFFFFCKKSGHLQLCLWRQLRDIYGDKSGHLQASSQAVMFSRP